MLFRLIRGALFRQKGKMALIAFTIALGASLATAMLNVMLDVGDKVNQELKAYGANIIVRPKDSSLLSDIYAVEDRDGAQLRRSWLREDELGRLKTIFWAFNILDFAPFNETQATLPDGSSAVLVGTWFNHHMDLPTGESLDTGVANLRSWWDILEGRWIDEQSEEDRNGVMLGTALAQRLQLHAGDPLTLTGTASSVRTAVVGIFDAGGDGRSDLRAAGPDAITERTAGKVSSVEVSALTTPDNDLRRAAKIRWPCPRDYETWYRTA